MTKPIKQDAVSGLGIGPQLLAGPHAPGLLGGAPADNLQLSELNGKRVRLQMPVGGKTLLLTGNATYQGGSGLTIRLDDEPDTEICLSESAFGGRIVRDTQGGAELFISLSADGTRHQPVS